MKAPFHRYPSKVPECAVMSHGCNTKSLRLEEGFVLNLWIKTRSAVLAGVNGQKENLKQSVANSLNVLQTFFLPVHFCVKNSRM